MHSYGLDGIALICHLVVHPLRCLLFPPSLGSGVLGDGGGRDGPHDVVRAG